MNRNKKYTNAVLVSATKEPEGWEFYLCIIWDSNSNGNFNNK